MEISDYRVVLNKSVYAEFTLYIPKFDLEICRCREFRMNGEKGPRRWFSFPSHYSEEGGEKKWKPTVRFRMSATESNLWEAVKEQVDALIAAHPELEVKPIEFTTDSSNAELPF